jgi:hypothetical protein
MRKLRILTLLFFGAVSIGVLALVARGATAALTSVGLQVKGEGVGSTQIAIPDQIATGPTAGNVPDPQPIATQLMKLREALQIGHKGGVNILWLRSMEPTGSAIESAFRDSGWTVATLPIGMGNLPTGITITGESHNVAVQAAKLAFDKSGIKYRYQNQRTSSITPSMMGPCDVAITVSNESP